MANQEHLDVLAKGVEAWNAWREANPDVVPDLQKADLTGCTLSKKDGKYRFQGINLQNADLTFSILKRTNLAHANLQGATLIEANLTDATLQRANLKRANLARANLSKANLNGANLNRAILCSNSLLFYGVYKESVMLYLVMRFYHWLTMNSFSKRMFNEKTQKHFDDSFLEFCVGSQWSSLDGANLSRCSIKWANIKNADLRFANLSNAIVIDVKYNRNTLFQGIRLDSCYGSQVFKSYANDQSYIEEFRSKSIINRIVYYAWLITSNCGRSMLIWSLWSTVLLAGFAWKYHQLGSISFACPANTWDWSAQIYFSFVTFTTLGFGDIYPVTPTARLWVMAEVTIGYIMLGGLISILANKLAKRA